VGMIRWAARKPAAGIDRDLVRQLVRAVTSMGANLEDARAAETKADFVHKVSIARKESLEAHYWARLLLSQAEDSRLTDLSHEINEIAAILTAIGPRGRASPQRG
jgi:four helix bundle protein